MNKPTNWKFQMKHIFPTWTVVVPYITCNITMEGLSLTCHQPSFVLCFCECLFLFLFCIYVYMKIYYQNKPGSEIPTEVPLVIKVWQRIESGASSPPSEGKVIDSFCFTLAHDQIPFAFYHHRFWYGTRPCLELLLLFLDRYQTHIWWEWYINLIYCWCSMHQIIHLHAQHSTKIKISHWHMMWWQMLPLAQVVW